VVGLKRKGGQQKAKLWMRRIIGGVGNHLIVLNRELPQQQSLVRGEELGQPQQNLTNPGTACYVPELLQGKTARPPSLPTFSRTRIDTDRCRTEGEAGDPQLRKLDFFRLP
jgi:hypothetical protein